MFQAKDFVGYDGRSATFDALALSDRLRGVYRVTGRGRRAERLRRA